MFPPSLQWVPWPPLAGPCGSPPSRVLWGRTTAPPSIHGHLWSPLVAGTSSEEMGSSLGFLENPFESMPRARDSGGPRTSSPSRPSGYRPGPESLSSKRRALRRQVMNVRIRKSGVPHAHRRRPRSVVPCRGLVDPSQAQAMPHRSVHQDRPAVDDEDMFGDRRSIHAALEREPLAAGSLLMATNSFSTPGFTVTSRETRSVPSAFITPCRSLIRRPTSAPRKTR